MVRPRTFHPAFISASIMWPQATHRNTLPCLFFFSTCPHAEHPCEVYAGLTRTSLFPASASLYASMLPVIAHPASKISLRTRLGIRRVFFVDGCGSSTKAIPWAAADGAVTQGEGILGSIFGSKDVSRAVASHAAGQTGLDIGALKALLPMVAMMAASALGNGAAPAQGGVGGLLGGLLGGGNQGGAAGTLINMLDANKDGNPLDDIMGMAAGFLKR